MSTTSNWAESTIEPYAHQSGGILFTKWISLLTLALAPLIAHVLSGTPHVTSLAKRDPKWHEVFCHFNPTSILWRYAAIADRRIRSERNTWNVNTMAATNALFWTNHGWDGSEGMIIRSQPYCTRLPARARMRFFSVEMLESLIITFQGVQIAVMLISSILDTTGLAESRLVTLENVFFPLAIIGLLRLCAAMWLTDDFAYTVYSSKELDPSNPATRLAPSTETPLDEATGYSQPAFEGFKPVHHWTSIVFRMFYLSLILGVLVLTLLLLIPWSGPSTYTISALVMGFFYVFFLFTTAAVYSWYFVTKGITTTVIPCINQTWYKLYTITLMIVAVGLLAITCIETRQTPCGEYSLLPPEHDMAICTTTRRVYVPMNPKSHPAFTNETTFGIVMNDIPDTPWNQSQQDWVVKNFTGSCYGVLSDGADIVQRTGTANVTDYYGAYYKTIESLPAYV